MRRIAPILALLAALAVLLQTEITAPPDTDTWTPGAFQGEVVHSLIETPDSIMAGTQDGLHRLLPNGGAERIPEVPGPVYAMSANQEEIYAGTEDGVYALPTDGEPPRRDGLSGVTVRDVSASESRLYAATDDGLFERVDGEWERTWPRPANAALAVEGGAIVGSAEGIFRIEGGGEAERVWSGGAVESLVRDGWRLWAGARGEPRLLASRDPGRSWGPRGGGILLEAVNTLAADPNDSNELLVGGSGLADGENLAGVMSSGDGGENWEAGQNRLSNTHVYALAARREPTRLEVALPPILEPRGLDLPFETTRFYAGTNGSGVYTYRPASGPLSTLASVQPAMRFVEPALAGAILLALAWSLYFGRGRRRKSEPPE